MFLHQRQRLSSPVGCSSTLTSIIFKFFSDPSFVSLVTCENNLLDLRFETDLSSPIFVKGSPSSISNSPLMTSSLVTLFPRIFILSTKTFSPSKIFNLIEILSSFLISSTLCSTNCKSFFSTSSSIESKSFLILNGE